MASYPACGGGIVGCGIVGGSGTSVGGTGNGLLLLLLLLLLLRHRRRRSGFSGANGRVTEQGAFW